MLCAAYKTWRESINQKQRGVLARGCGKGNVSPERKLDEVGLLERPLEERVVNGGRDEPGKGERGSIRPQGASNAESRTWTDLICSVDVAVVAWG
jgi:hypothetical protein